MHSCARNGHNGVREYVYVTPQTKLCCQKVCLRGAAGPGDKLCIQELGNMVGALQSTVGGLCTVQCENKVREEDKMGGKVPGLCRGYANNYCTILICACVCVRPRCVHHS